MGLPGVIGNKGTLPFTFREQGNKRKIRLGTREQKHILGNREHQNTTGTQGKVCWEQGNRDTPENPSLIQAKGTSELQLSVDAYLIESSLNVG